jgi:hypothetical protein
VVVADVNADNWPDVLVANRDSDNIGIFLNTGKGTFISQTTYSTGSGPRSVIVVDVNDDDKVDIVVTNKDSNNVSVFLSLGYESNQTKMIN